MRPTCVCKILEILAQKLEDAPFQQGHGFYFYKSKFMITRMIFLLEYTFIFMTFLEFGCDLTEIESNETKATRQIFKWNTLTVFWHMNVYLDFYFEKR